MGSTLPRAAVLASAILIAALPTKVEAAGGDLIEIVSPAKLESFDCYPVEVLIDVDFARLPQAEVPGIFRLRLNGRDLDQKLEPTDTGFRALVSPEDGLHLRGRNSLTAIATRPDGRLEFHRRAFLVRIDDSRPPTANAGVDQVAFLGETVHLDGKQSSDPGCTSARRYHWRFLDTPEGSAAQLAGSNTAEPTFEPDVAGTYVAELVVSNGAFESEADTVTIAVNGINALSVSPVQSPVLDALGATLQPVAYDGTQDVSKFDIVVVDGDALSPDQLRDNEVVNEAFHLGKHILAVDLTPEHKKAWLLGLLNFASAGPADGVLVQQGKDQGGYPIIRMSEIPSSDELPTTTEGGATGPQSLIDAEATQAQQTEAFATTVLDSLRDPGLWDQPDPPPIPPDLIHVQWVFHINENTVVTGSGKGRAGNQTLNQATNYTYTLLLDNGSNPQGDSQFLVIQADGEMNPVAAGQFIAWRKDERAWFQDRMLMNISPGQNGIWNWVASAPETPNALTTYSSGIAFSVAYSQKQGPSTSFQWNSGKSWTVSDWGVKALGAATAQSWNWRSQSPGNTDKAGPNDDYGVNDGGWFATPGSDYPKVPNQLCQTQMQYHSSVVWQSNRREEGIADINTFTGQHYVDLWCANDFGLLCTSKGSGPDKLSAATTSVVNRLVSINLAAVIPLQISNLAFEQNPVVGGDKITATISLESPALMDIPIQLQSSNTDVATVTGLVTIKKGQSTAQFDVQTLRQTQTIDVVIQAFYAQRFQAKLTVSPES